MFEKARLKLTFWYLLIIMIVSLSFSAVIYRGATNEFERSLDTIEQRLRLRQFGLLPPEGRELVFIQDLVEARNQIILILAYANGTIFVLSIIAGNLLAGKTLEQIEKALEKQKRFVADASHELKTPITSLYTSIEVALRDKHLTLKDAKITLKDSLEDVEGLKALTENLLTLARTNQVSIKFERIEVSDVTKTLEKRFRSIAKTKKVRLDVKPINQKISTSREDLEKILSIFLDNAIKYTRSQGTVRLIVIRNRRFVIFKVADNGIGISKDDKTKIFDRFYRVDSSRSSSDDHGYGLGLSIANDIADRNGWKLTCTSKLAAGSTFTVTLPLWL